MIIVKPKVELLPQVITYEDVLKNIELAGRVCYKSEHQIKEGSAEKFVNRLIKLGHTSVLEHGTIYLTIDNSNSVVTDRDKILNRYLNNPYSKVMTQIDDDNITSLFITTNLRVLVENDWMSDLEYISKEITVYHNVRHTFKIICSRIQSQSYERHRVFSFSQESTRYCNYSQDRFSNEIVYCTPHWITAMFNRTGDGYTVDKGTPTKSFVNSSIWLSSLRTSEENYFSLLEGGVKPEDARGVLPNDLKTEFYMTGFTSDWLGNFRTLRLDERAAHPEIYKQSKEIIELIECSPYYKLNIDRSF